MNLADLSIRRPIFITCIVMLMLSVGWMCMKRLGVDLFPDVTFPIVTVNTAYPGAGPQEIETLITKPIEEELSTLSGLKRLTSANYEGLSQVVAEFRLSTDIKYAEQQIRDRIGVVKPELPRDIEEPVIRRIDPADEPIVVFSLEADLADGPLYDLADDVVKPKLEQVNEVGVVEITGGRKREIHVLLDRRRLRDRELSVSSIADKLRQAGENIPSGKVNEGAKETTFRAVGQFQTLDDIKKTMVSLFGNEIPTAISQLGSVVDTLKDETSRSYINGKKALLINVYRQSGSNTVEVADNVFKAIDKINHEIGSRPGHPKLAMVRDASLWIRINVQDVKDAIFIGITLTIVVVFFFLANLRSTLITGLALPNSLLGAFILMTVAGFTINIVTLLSLSLAVGLLVDDAIVVRENIFRHMEMGKAPADAAREGTAEVRIAVLATTLTVLAVFGPISFIQGFTGQFFRQFGLTICFAMVISLFDALTIAPMLSAYFAESTHHLTDAKHGIYDRTVGALLRAFDRFQTWLENRYEGVLRFTVKRPLVVLGLSFVVFASSLVSVGWVPKTFIPPQDAGEFAVGLDMPPGTSLDRMGEVAFKTDGIIRANKEVAIASLTVGGRNQESNKASFYVRMVPFKERSVSTQQFKDKLREQLKAVSDANPIISDFGAAGENVRPFTLNFMGTDQEALEKVTSELIAILRKHPGLKDVDTNFRPGKPEFQIELMADRARLLGMTTRKLGDELRAQVEGIEAAKFRENGLEYDVRVRVLPDQRNIRETFGDIYVPNLNDRLIPLRSVAKPVFKTGPAVINRQDRARYIQIAADLAPKAGLGDVMNDVENILKTQVKVPEGIRYGYVGDSENFQEFGNAMLAAIGLSVLFIFFVLSSLYESFVTPFTIMLALPLAICGAFFALFITQESINLFSMIGVVMLLGVASKNAILLVDYANRLVQEGSDRATALIKAGKTRLRPILMTSIALIAGTLPIAIGLNEASRQRTSMGIAIIGGLISSTVLSLLVVPAVFSYVDRFRVWSLGWMKRIFMPR